MVLSAVVAHLTRLLRLRPASAAAAFVRPAVPPARASAAQSFEMSTPHAAKLQHARHVKYWQRCLSTCLPTEYTATDLNRMTLAFFSVAALDVLGALPTTTTPAARTHWADWIYACQLPCGGFRGSPATAGLAPTWDPPNLPASYFAVAALVSLGDDLTRLRRADLLRLLPRLQRADGSFGEWLNVQDGTIVGDTDMRFLYCAAALRWMLRGREGEGMKTVPDFDVDGAVGFIQSSETYDHGISAKPFEEAHGGLTYCAIGALSLLDRLHTTHPLNGVSSHANVVRWLVHRQLPFENRDGYDPDEYDDILVMGTHAEQTEATKVELGTNGRPLWGGFNGRTNKRGDTCYSFWVGASLDMLKKLHLIDVNANRRFLLEKTQHIIGGFAKVPQPGTPPDILHSFLGLAALALMREEGLNRLDAALCVSLQAKERLMALPWWLNGTED